MILPLIRNADIVGNSFREPEEKEIFSRLQPGDKLRIELEPTNQFDQFAVKILAEGRHVGYVPAIISASIFAMDPAVLPNLIIECTGAKGNKRAFSLGMAA